MKRNSPNSEIRIQLRTSLSHSYISVAASRCDRHEHFEATARLGRASEHLVEPSKHQHCAHLARSRAPTSAQTPAHVQALHQKTHQYKASLPPTTATHSYTAANKPQHQSYSRKSDRTEEYTLNTAHTLHPHRKVPHLFLPWRIIRGLGWRRVLSRRIYFSTSSARCGVLASSSGTVIGI